MTSNAGRYPISAQCRVPGVPKSTYYAMRNREEAEPEPDPLTGDVVAAHRDSRGRYGARKIKRVLAGKGKVAPRRRVTRMMKEGSLASACAKPKRRAHADAPNEAELPNVPDGPFDGHAPHTRLASGLAYARVLSVWRYACPLVDLASREIVGPAAGARKDAELVKSAFATVAFPLFDIDVFRSDRRSEFDNMALDEMFEAFGITRPLSKKGCPHGNAVVESTNKTLKAEFVYRESFDSLEGLQVKPSECVWWYDHERIHSKLGYMSPVEFREKPLTIPSE